MNLPMDSNERFDILDRASDIGSKENKFSYEEIKDYKLKNMFQDGDILFLRRNSDNEEFGVVYFSEKWFLITGEPSLVEISESLFEGKDLMIHTACKNLYQIFIEENSKEKFDKLSVKDKCDVFLGKYEINKCLDGVKSALSDIIDVLKKENCNKEE